MDDLEEANKIIRILCHRYKARSELVEEATYQAYSEVIDKREEIENFPAYWYVTAKHRLVNMFRQEAKQPLMEDWEVPAVDPEEDEDVLPDYRDLFTEVHDIVYDRLSEEHYISFISMRQGITAQTEADQSGVARESIYRRRKEMLHQCKDILSEVYTSHEFYKWKKVTNTSPHINTTVLVKLENGLKAEAFRIKPHIWIWGNGHTMTQTPVEWKEC